MGIRFLCPNGHKLNVKAFLAGERGICPQCDAKFLVPRESGKQVEAIEENAVEEDSGPGAPGLHRSDDSPPPPPVPSLPPATEEAWCVRMASGEQFGPANTEVMRSWIAEGRVPANSWVWRTGWPDWKPGSQAITLLNGPAAPSVPAPPTVPVTPTPMTPASEPKPSVAPVDVAPVELPDAVEAEALPTATTATTQYQNTKRNRQDRARKVTLLLGVVVMLLLVVLVVVLIKK